MADITSTASEPKDATGRVLHGLVLAVIALSIVVTSVGVFSSSGGEAFEVTNQYGDLVTMYGDGIYARDSYFKAPIFRGSDLTMLLVAVPLLIVALILDIKASSLRRRLFLVSMIPIFAYYAASIALGASYNALHLLYIALFSASFFAVIVAMMRIDYRRVEAAVTGPLPYRALSIFLALTGIALFVAWLPDIVAAIIAGRPPELIEVYTTEVTYVLDMGIISPIAIVCLVLLTKRKGMGYVLLSILLATCLVIGIMLPVQTAFQVAAGIELPLAALISKVGIFVVLALFALFFIVRLMKAVKA